MKIGFSGSRIGLTDSQKYHFSQLLLDLKGNEFHHGDAVGADADAHRIALNMGYAIVIHPPKNPSKRAFCKIGDILPEKDYLDRNKDIVDATDVLIATPKENTEQLRSGTWSTVRYARKKGKKVYIIKPDEPMPPPIFKSDEEVKALLDSDYDFKHSYED
jgi:hypothetical protein